ncbi:uncharacterized protein LOC134847905 isoform X2 [Symsagittifera roscoffensis]
MFSQMILTKVQALLDSVTCCPDHVTSLITILGSCGHCLQSSCKVIQVVLSYGNTFNTTPHLVHILHTATRTAIRNRVMCKEVIDELLDYLTIHTDRVEIQETCLECLLQLAQRVSHAWTNTQSNHLLKFCIDQKNNEKLFGQSVRVASYLPVSSVFGSPEAAPDDSMDTGTGSESSKELVKAVMEICEEYCFTKEGYSVVHALNLYAKFAEFDDFIPVFEYTLGNSLQNGSQNSEAFICSCLDVLSQILDSANLCSISIYRSLTKALTTQIVDSSSNSANSFELLSFKSYKCLMLWLERFIDECRKLYERNHSNEKLVTTLKKNVSEITSSLKNVNVSNLPEGLLPTLVAVYFSSSFFHQNQTNQSQWIEAIISKCTNNWVLYKVSRNLMRYGQYESAHELISNILGESRSSKSISWMKVLNFLCIAEKELPNSEDRDFELVLKNYHMALRLLSSFQTKMANQEFQRTFLRLRFEFLDVCDQVLSWVTMARMFQFDDASEYQNNTLGALSQSLHHQWSQLKKVSLSYEELQRSIIDSDHSTRVLLSELQTQCRLLSMSMHALFLHGVASSIRLPEDHEIAEKKILEAKICERVIKSKSQNSWHRLDCLFEVTEWVLQTPLRLPRFFLQCLRSTSVQLITSITQSLSGEATTVFAGDNLTFKTEGVVSQVMSRDKDNGDNRKRATQLTVKRCKVIYQVKLLQAASSRSVAVSKIGFWSSVGDSLMAPSDITDTVRVDRKGYFLSTVLIKPPLPGKYQVQLTLKLMEGDSDIEWNYNLVETVLLKAIDKNIR